MFLGSAAADEIKSRTGLGRPGPRQAEIPSSQRTPLRAQDHQDDTQLLF